jgi:hypothetical protein
MAHTAASERMHTPLARAFCDFDDEPSSSLLQTKWVQFLVSEGTTLAPCCRSIDSKFLRGMDSVPVMQTVAPERDMIVDDVRYSIDPFRFYEIPENVSEKQRCFWSVFRFEDSVFSPVRHVNGSFTINFKAACPSTVHHPTVTVSLL